MAGTSLPVRGAWIEIPPYPVKGAIPLSLPVRGAWIEIGHTNPDRQKRKVAPRKGSVD